MVLAGHRLSTEKYASMIEAAIDMEAVAKHEYFVKSSFDEQLMDCKQKMDEAEQSIDAHYADTLRALKMKDKDLKCVDRDDAKCFRRAATPAG